MTSSTHKLQIYIAIGLSLLIFKAGSKLDDELRSRAKQQTDAVLLQRDINAQAQVLAPLKAKWDSAFASAGGLIDQYRIVQRLAIQSTNLVLQSNEIMVGEVQAITYQGRNNGMLFYPVSNSAGTSLALTAPDYATAWIALTELQKRPDVRFSRARIDKSKNSPTLILENFGLLAVNDQTGK